MIATAFTPIASLAGGALIGLSAVMLMAVSGRIAGVSSIAIRLLPPYADNEFAGRLAFVAGLVAAPVVVFAVTGRLPAQTIQASAVILAVAGFLVVSVRYGATGVRPVTACAGFRGSRCV